MALIGKSNEHLYNGELILDDLYLFCHFGDEDIQLFRTLKETMMSNWKDKIVVKSGNKNLILMRYTDIFQFKTFIRSMSSPLQQRVVSFVPFDKKIKSFYLKQGYPISGHLNLNKAIHINIPNIDDPAVISDLDRISY